MKRFVPAKNTAQKPQRKLEAREAAQVKAAAEKKAARGDKKNLAHNVYPHLD